MNVGDRIHERRLELGLSVDQLAALCGKSRATIYRYESGAIEDMSCSVLPPIAVALRTTPSALMGWEAHPVNVVSDSERIASIYRQLDDEGRKSLMEFAEFRLSQMHAKKGEAI